MATPEGAAADSSDLPPGTQVIGDATSLRIGTIWQENRDRARLEYGAPSNGLRAKFTASRGASTLVGQEAAEALEGYLEEIETSLERILSARSRFFWTHLLARIPPKPIEGSSRWTTSLYRSTLDLAILKHGVPDVVIDGAVDGFFVQDGQTFPEEITYEDVLAIYNAEHLAWEYAMTAAAYRRVCKGARLDLQPGFFDAPASSDTEALITILDDRTSEYSSLLSALGAVIGDIDEDPLSGGFMVLVPNVESAELPAVALEAFGFPKLATPFVPNHVIGVPRLDDLLGVFSEFDEFEEHFGLDGPELAGALWALSWQWFTRARGRPEVAYHFLQRGYLIVEEEALEGHVALAARWYGEYARRFTQPVDDDRAREIIARSIDVLTYTDNELGSIDLRTRAPVKLCWRLGDGLLVDYPKVLMAGRWLFTEVLRGFSSTWNARGSLFERAVLDEIERTDVELWQCGTKLRIAGGGERQVDVAFVVGNTLVVVECKAYSANPNIDIGHYWALQDRWSQLEKYLEQSRSLAEWIDSHRSGVNFSVPDRVDRVDHILCTPVVEFIPERGDRLWLDDEIPRICTPVEVRQYAEKLQEIG